MNEEEKKLASFQLSLAISDLLNLNYGDVADELEEDKIAKIPTLHHELSNCRSIRIRTE